MGLYDDIDNEVLGGKTNTNNNSASVGLFDEIDNEVLNAPQEPSFMDNVKDFGDKVLRKGQLLKGGIEENVLQPNQYGVTPLQGVGNIVHDLGQFGKGVVTGLPQFAKELGHQTVETFQNLKGNQHPIATPLLSFYKGFQNEMPYSIAHGIESLPEAIASSYNHREFNPDNVPHIFSTPAQGLDTLIDLLKEKGLINQGFYDSYKGTRKSVSNYANKAPIAQTLGEFATPMVGAGVVANAGKTLKYANNLNKAQKVGNLAKDLGKAGAVGAGYGFVTTPDSLANRSQAGGSGFVAGTALGAGGKVLSKTAPKIAKGVKNVSAEIVDRLNPENYEQVINSKPVKKGTGLSQRTVYEPEVRYEYKPKRNTYNMKDALGKERITKKGTDFTMGESGELKTPERPVKKKYGVSTNVQYTPNFTIERVAPSVFAKQQAKTEAKAEARQEQMENLAPNTMAEQKAKAEVKEAQKEAEKRGHHTKDFNKGDIVRDIHSGHIYEVIEPDKRGMGKLRDVDTDEIRTPNADNNAHYEKYEHNPDDLIEVKEFKYDPKENKRANSDLKTQQDYMYSKQEVVDAYNEYVKNPTEANREKYEDVSGKALKEFHDNEEAIKNGTFNQRVETTEKVNTNDVVGSKGNAKDNIVPIDIDENSVPKFEKISQLKGWIAENLNLIGDITIKQNNRTVQFSKSNISRSMKGINRSDVKRNSYSKLRELVENSIYDKSKTNDERHPNINGQEVYYNKFNYKGQTFGIEIVVDIPKSKNTPYTYAGHKIKVAPAVTRVSSDELTSNRPSASNIVPQNEEKITSETVKQPKKTVKQKCDEAKELVNKELSKYIPDEQRSVILENIKKSAEKEHFADLMFKLKEKIDNAPGLYGTDGDKNAKPILKYFAGNIDAYIFEIDKETGEMFGIGSMGHEYEAGYYTPDTFNSLKSSISSNKDGTFSIKPAFELDLYDDLNVTKEDLLNGTLEKSEKIVNNEDKKGDSNGLNERTVLQQSGLEEKEPRVNEESDRTGRTEPETSSSVSELGRTDDTGLSNGRRLTDSHKSIIEAKYKNQHELNTAIENFINNKEYEVYNGNLPDEVKSFLKKYAGAGGLEKQGAEGKGLLSEYYTPDNVVKKMWDLTSQYINPDGAKVLEPSVGIGRFLEHAPKGTSFDVVEMNPVSAKITELLYPDANVTVGQFQERFIDKSKNLPIKEVTPEYDIVIGNPPYGEYSGMYKGLGEGKKYRTLQAYFINRGLDTLKENGVMTFIVPSSFLENINDKLEISGKAELLDAYRLPEKTFDTTSIGTDIIVMRKRTGQGQDTNFVAEQWFKKHPEKILGTQETRKNRFGKEETYVKGDKNAVEKIDTSAKDIQETETVIEKHPEPKKAKTTRKSTKKNEQPKTQGNVKYNEYKHENPISEEDMPYYTDTRVDGTLPEEKYSPNEKVNQFDGKLYNDFNYLQGDIYEKLDALEHENISEKQKEIQRKKLQSVLPTPKKLSQMNISPSSDFVKEFSVKHKVIDRSTNEEVDEDIFLDRKYLDYVSELTNSERNGLSVWDIRDFVSGKAVRTNYRGYSLSKEEKANQRAEFMTKLKNTVDKTFNDFINSELSIEDMKRLEEAWNRQFNKLYTPDYKKIPMIVKGLSDTFYGSKLKLQDVQVEGVNYLTNKGIGLLGFEVGVGKTLSGTIATVQNMQMGRCKKPLILVPKSVKPNWIREIHEAFPNIKINDVDNLSKFSGEIEDGSISVGTYQALDNLWYNEDTVKKLSSNASKVRTDFNRESTKRGREKSEERNAEFIGKAMQGNKMLHRVEDLGFDHITVDEAHNFKNLFGDAKADGQEGNPYSKITGAESTRAKRLFLLTQYILENNNNRNVFMLTATPFNNSPLEVFNMLSYMAKDKLDDMGIYNVYQFMENYVDIGADWVVDSKNNVSFKQIAKGYKNLQSLQSIIDSCMLMRSAEDAGIKRPNKITRQFALEPTEEQKKLIAKMEALAVGIDVDNEGNIRTLSREELKGAQLKAITRGRIATLSPDIFNNNLEVSPEDFIKNSPKLDFVMRAIEANKKKDKDTSQLVYMPIGTDFLPKIKQYLVDKGVYKADEIAIIQGGITDDKINSTTDSFNDRNGKIKVIIGTNKIKEGMNLNKNSSVLYIPFIDWNPTDFVQVVGRIWRRGNRYKTVRVIVPTLNDSSDSFMFQKLDEKTSRINNIMDRGKDYIDTGELNASEEKINMITNPDKKAMMFSQIEQQKLENKISNLRGQLEDVRHYKRELERAKNNIKYQQEGIDRNTEKLKGIEDKESWSYSSTKNYIDTYKRELKKAEKHLEYIENKINRLELDFEGKDSEENIQKQIEAVQKEIENLKETTELKKAEYKDEYERNRKEGKKLEDYIAEFEKETDELLKSENDAEEINDIDIPDFMKTENNNFVDIGEDIDLSPIYEQISKGVKGKDLAQILPDEIAEIISNGAINYTFKEMLTKDSNKRGRHIGKKATILLNLEAFGNSPYKFIKTLVHELEHARQHKIYLQISAKSRNTWTVNEREFVAHYNICKRVNKERQTYYNKHKDLIDKFDKSNFYSEEERDNSILQLSEDEQAIIYQNDQNVLAYLEAKHEADARAEGLKYAENYKKVSGFDRRGKIGTQSQNNGAKKKWSLGANSRDSITEGEYSAEPSEYRQVETPAKQDKIKIEKATRDSLYQWYGEVEKARYDVDKDLNQFNKITKSTAKDFSNKTGLRVSDKMIREILPFLRERTEVPKALGRKDLSKFYSKLTKDDITRLTKLADNVCDKFDKYWQNYKDAKGVITDEDIENHISHLWNVGKNQKGVLTNYFATNSRFAKPRTIETLVKGIEQGYEPRTLDIAEILKIQSDSLIKSANDSILAEKLKKMRYNKQILIQPSSKAPADWVEIDHPALNKAVYTGSTDNGVILSKRSVKVHPAVAEIIAPVFEVQKADREGLFSWKVYDNINGTLKQVQLGFSGFHGFALTESSIGNSYLKNTLKHLNPKKFVDAILNDDYDIFKQEKIAKDGIEHGLKLGTPSDLNRSNVEKFLSNIPIIGKLTEANNKILWDCLHNSFKIEAYKMKCDEVGENITTEQKRAIAQWVNDSFGGQAWELLGVKNSTIKGLSRALLSPDWLISTTRQFMGMAENVPVSKWLEKCDIKALKKFAKISGVSDIGDNLGVRGKSARKFWVTAMVFSVLFYNLINAMFRAKDKKEHPEYYSDNTLMSYTIWDNALPGDKASTKLMPYIFIGRNKDGSARYLRLGKQFREVPEMLSEPVSKLSMKSATVPSALANVGLGYSIGDVPKKLAGKDTDVYYNQEIWNGYGKFAKKKQGAELYKGMGKTALKSVAPFIVNNAMNEHHNFSGWDVFAQTSNGLGYTKAKKQYLYAYEHENNPKDFEKITRKGIQDGMSYRKLKSAKKKAESEYKQNIVNEYAEQYVEALKQQNQSKINKVSDKLEKENVPAKIRTKVYKEALKEYRKSVK